MYTTMKADVRDEWDFIRDLTHRGEVALKQNDFEALEEIAASVEGALGTLRMYISERSY